MILELDKRYRLELLGEKYTVFDRFLNRRIRKSDGSVYVFESVQQASILLDAMESSVESAVTAVNGRMEPCLFLNVNQWD